MKPFHIVAALPLLLAAAAVHAHPAVMVQAKDCVVTVGGPGFGTCVETYNQAGLNIGYVDEVTSLHPYVAIPPLHTTVFAGNEWFSNSGTTSAEVSYLVAASSKIRWIDHFVLWNEESSGIGAFNLWYGHFPGHKFDLVLGAINPVDNPLLVLDFQYAPEVWEFSKRPRIGWWTLEMWDCPQPNPGSFPSCAIGEVAWGGPQVPEPGTWAMLIAGFGLLGVAARRRRRKLAFAA
jgi:hypothetical protein